MSLVAAMSILLQLYGPAGTPGAAVADPVASPVTKVSTDDRPQLDDEGAKQLVYEFYGFYEAAKLCEQARGKTGRNEYAMAASQEEIEEERSIVDQIARIKSIDLDEIKKGIAEEFAGFELTSEFNEEHASQCREIGEFLKASVEGFRAVRDSLNKG